VDASQIDAIDYRTTNSVEILRYKIEHLIAKVIKLEQANETLRSEIEDLNYDIEMLERSVYD
jgi:cell division protein FtsB